MNDRKQLLTSLLLQVRDQVDSPTTDISWSKYDSLEELLQFLDILIKKVKESEEDSINSIIEDLKLLFAPTGSLQEISISSGWTKEFLELSQWW
ncbi:hypothetical protein GQF01_22650 [Paenibacillus sp. 5J-6]|uniref:Uncharacterized protein n=1 Tax=Paenibacillus silvestris TaxID=2606219 RepID=A0A6L8V3L5_9BACL|nr:hypothetical protein [Paenibacillus silvestris]MZQ84915.1 hypothetical protein [Paenibacillus silvestris]